VCALDLRLPAVAQTQAPSDAGAASAPLHAHVYIRTTSAPIPGRRLALPAAADPY
jgi:hypothetical protein